MTVTSGSPDGHTTSGVWREFPDHEHFSMARGPFARLARRLHLAHADYSLRAGVIVAFTWVPLCASALLRVATGAAPEPILFDISVHVRLLVVIPVLVLAERQLDLRCAEVAGHLYDGGFAERGALDRILEGAEHLRDSHAVELAIAIAAVLAGQASLWGLWGPTGMVSGVDHGGAASLAGIWYASVALPLVLFLLCRWLWHWTIWSYIVLRISRLKLATIATHPDHAGGIGFLAAPISAFSILVAAAAALLASAWGDQVLEGRAEVQAFAPSFIAFVVLAVAVACGPMLAFIGQLYHARYREIRHYNLLALDYVRGFDRKWIGARPSTKRMFGTQDFQSLADLGNSYESLRRIRLVPVGAGTFLSLWIAALIPMIPLVAATMPIEDLLRKLIGIVL